MGAMAKYLSTNGSLGMKKIFTMNKPAALLRRSHHLSAACCGIVIKKFAKAGHLPLFLISGY
jgi:hypothetical protein